jgi:hypothetical protein
LKDGWRRAGIGDQARRASAGVGHGFGDEMSVRGERVGVCSLAANTCLK